MTTPRTMQTRPDRPASHAPLDYSNLPASMLERAAVAPVPKLTTYAEMLLDAQDIALRQGGRVGRKPKGQAATKGPPRRRYNKEDPMTPVMHEMLALIKKDPGKTAEQYSVILGRHRRSVNFYMMVVCHHGHNVVKSRGRVPTYSMGKKK